MFPARNVCLVPLLPKLDQHSISLNFLTFPPKLKILREKWYLTDGAFSVILLSPSLLLKVGKESYWVLRSKKAAFRWKCLSCLSH